LGQVHNRNTKLQPYQFSHRVWTPSRREATRGDLGSATALRRALPSRVRAALERHLAYDFLLYEQARALAKRAVSRHLFAPPDAEARGATGVDVPIRTVEESGAAGLRP